MTDYKDERDNWQRNAEANAFQAYNDRRRAEQAEAQLAECQAELKRLTTCSTCGTTHYACDCGIKARYDLEKENARLREALAFYADNENWMGGDVEAWPPAIKDGGTIAREVMGGGVMAYLTADDILLLCGHPGEPLTDEQELNLAKEALESLRARLAEVEAELASEREAREKAEAVVEAARVVVAAATTMDTFRVMPNLTEALAAYKE